MEPMSQQPVMIFCTIGEHKPILLKVLPLLIIVVANSTSKIVLSPSDFLYLNKGHGNIWLNATAGDYSTWRQIYENFTLFPAGVDRSRILGA